jgi:hypothetical protein
VATVRAEQLNGTHLGLQVRVEGMHGKAEGVLTSVSHKADLIEDAPLGLSGFFYPPAIGRKGVDLTFANGTLQVEPGASVEVRTQ